MDHHETPLFRFIQEVLKGKRIMDKMIEIEKCIEFAKGQYVVIDDFNRLVSAFSLISE